MLVIIPKDVEAELALLEYPQILIVNGSMLPNLPCRVLPKNQHEYSCNLCMSEASDMLHPLQLPSVPKNVCILVSKDQWSKAITRALGTA